MDQKNTFSSILRTKHYPNQCIHSLYRASSTERLEHSAKIVFIFSLRTAHNRLLYVVDTTHIAISHAIRDNLRKKNFIVTFCCLLNVLHASRFSNKRTKRKQSFLVLISSIVYSNPMTVTITYLIVYWIINHSNNTKSIRFVRSC